MSLLFFYKQKTAYEMRISDWSSDVCSSDLCSARLVSSSSFVIDQDRPDPCRGAAPDRDPFHVPDPSRPYRPCAASFPDARGRRRRELPSVRACFLGPPSWRAGERPRRHGPPPALRMRLDAQGAVMAKRVAVVVDLGGRA